MSRAEQREQAWAWTQTLRARLESALAGDQQKLLADEVPPLARVLAETVDGLLREKDPAAQATPADLAEMLRVLTWTYWIRASALPGRAGEYDREACLAVAGVLYPLLPDAVPPDVRPLVHHRDTQFALPDTRAAKGRARARTHLDMFAESGERRSLDAAIREFQRAALRTPSSRPDYPEALSQLGVAIYRRFLKFGRKRDLREAIVLFRRTVDNAGPNHPELARYLFNLAGSLQERFQATGRVEDLDEAQEAAIDAADLPHRSKAAHMARLSSILQARFELSGESVYLEAANDFLRESLGFPEVQDEPLPASLNGLGTGLRMQFQLTGDRELLEEAIDVGRRAVHLTAEDDDSRVTRLGNLSSSLAARYETTHQLSDLNESIELQREVLATIAPRATFASGLLSNLSADLQKRFKQTDSLDDLDEAIAVGQRALDLVVKDDPKRARRLTHLALALGHRSRVRNSPSDLDQAVDLAKQSVDSLPTGHHEQSMMLSNLGFLLTQRFEVSGSGQDLDEAIISSQKALSEAVTGTPGRIRYTMSLTMALKQRFDSSGQRSDLDEAIRLLRSASVSPTAASADRLVVCQLWGQFAMLAGDVVSAAEGYATAIELLPLVAWHGLDQPTREYHLQGLMTLAPCAATTAILTGHPQRAVELLEAGRATLWTQTLNLRMKLDSLENQDLAARLEASRLILDRHPDDEGADALDERRAAAREWDRAVEEVRSLDGFENFLLPPRFAELQEAAAGGAVVLVNVSIHGSHALILTPGSDLTTIPLPQAEWDTTMQQALTLIDARRRAPAPGPEQQPVLDVLAWAWRAIAEPVLSALGYEGQQIDDGDAPQICWCTTGPATVLPLHAAGEHASSGKAVSDRVISSYTPTLGTLIRARARPAPPRPKVLIVGVPDAPNSSPIPGVLDEIDAVTAILPIPEQGTLLLRSAATREAVLRGITQHEWIHLSCHGVQHESDAMKSAFLLQDGPLSLSDIASLNLPQADFAYLAACQTATGDLRMPDESLHLAGGLQVAGYRHVIASLWNISDDAAAMLAAQTYDQLSNPTLESADAATALHRAVTPLRERHPDDPLLWAAYIHIGP